MEMSRLTRDGTAEPVSRDRILRRERGQGKLFFLVHLTTSRIGNLTRLFNSLAICYDHTYIYIYIYICMYVCTVTHIARVRINRVRSPVLLVVS